MRWFTPRITLMLLLAVFLFPAISALVACSSAGSSKASDLPSLTLKRADAEALSAALTAAAADPARSQADHARLVTARDYVANKLAADPQAETVDVTLSDAILIYTAMQNSKTSTVPTTLPTGPTSGG